MNHQTIESQQPKGLRAIAILEAGKGLLALIVGLALHELGGVEIQALCEQMLRHLRLNPAGEIPSVIHKALTSVDDRNLTIFALGTLLYAIVRFIEAYGLWRAFGWTEWFALASGAIYLPFEVYEVFTTGKTLAYLALVMNLLVVGYMALIIQKRYRNKPSA
ncbi:DUF2127 domain-containing protein [Grimontia marina]|uniref:DUF2127 domain-containing protein n=1 Tax=Grimontia marina TaxID=646534 RepID=A0A128FJ50_9GAMM|nr:DUF2127 domain-containing protein [Grimontia marina]CZF86600.1 hypothetical protein GMA8713_04634 [Grimontia marina]